MSKPKLRFKADNGSVYPEWKKNTLGDIGTFMKGASLSKADISETGTPFILYGELYTTYGEVAYDIKRKTQADVDPKYYSVPGDVVIPTSGESPEEISTATCVMTPGVILAGDLNIYRTDKVDGRIVSYLMNHQIKNDIARIAQGKSVVHIQAKNLEKLMVCYPESLEEQEKIASFFADLDEVIQTSEAEVAALEKQKKGAMQKIFSQEVRFKMDDGSDYPEWTEDTLANISERLLVGLATTVTPYYRETGVPMFRNLNIKAGYLDCSDMLYLDEKYASKQSGKTVNAGDILTVHTGNIGWSAVVPKEYDGALTFTTLITTVNSTIVNNGYVTAYLNSPFGMKGMKDLAFSGGRANLNVKEFEKLIVPIPCLEEQQKIADFLSDFDTAIDLAKQELEKWKLLKKGLMQQMFV